MGADASKGRAETPHHLSQDGLIAGESGGDGAHTRRGKRPMISTRSQSVPNPAGGYGGDCYSGGDDISTLGLFANWLINIYF